MDPFAQFGRARDRSWGIQGLNPLPEEEWRRILDFLALSDDERHAMLATVEILFRRGHELVVATYDYLLHNPDTAAILGWERAADPQHLAERRRFFTIWLARLLGLDMSDDLARYLFRAGKFHAGHGPRHTHVPPIYVLGSTSLIQAAFARFLTEELPAEPLVPTALAGWNKLLTAHLHLMQCGYQSTVALDSGDFPVHVALFGKMRTVTGLQELDIHLTHGASIDHALRKLFNYIPDARVEVFEAEWEGTAVVDHTNTPWFQPVKIYTVKPMWRILVNGKDVSYLQGAETPLHSGDAIQVFPPGR